MVPQYLSSLQDRLERQDWLRVKRVFAGMEQEIGRLVEDSIHHGLGDDSWKRLSTSACKYMRELAIQCFLGQLAKNVEMGLEGPNLSSTQRTTATSMDAFLVPQPADSDATEDAAEREEDGDATNSGEAGDATAKAEHGAATEHARGDLSAVTPSKEYQGAKDQGSTSKHSWAPLELSLIHI